MKLIESSNNRIKGTDGKMLDMMLEHTLQVVDVEEGDSALWERFVTTVLKLEDEYSVASIIDAGAILAGKDLRNHIVPWIASHKLFNTQGKFKGISYCHENHWKVYKLDSFEEIDRGTSISDDETFVIFD